jgi:ABC transport system ATP-binding/permease protein
MMEMLRRLADADRVIVVATHSLTFLDVCDQVLLLAPGGKTAFCGRPEELNSSLEASDRADIFAKVCADPDGMHRRFVQGRGSQDENTACRVAPVAPTVEPPRSDVWRQVSTVARRQVRLLIANRGYLAFPAVLPFIVGLLPLTVTGHAGLSHMPSLGARPFEAKHIVALTSFAAILMGTTLTVRDLVANELSSVVNRRRDCRRRHTCLRRRSSSARSR